MRRRQNLTRTAGQRQVRSRRHWLRWVVLGALLVAVLIGVAVAALGGLFIDLAKGTPALADLQRRVPAQTTMIFDDRGRLIAQLHGAVNRVIAPSSKLPVFLKEATVAIEDKRFYHEHGVDFQGIVRAALADLSAGRIVQGGSTITEQYVKNAYLSGGDTLTRKVYEAVLAWELAGRWSKDRVLTAYLNTVYYGDGAYGVQAAAQTYFHRNVAKLTLAQAALLAGLPQDPNGYSPIFDPADALARRNLVLQQMASQGYITQAQEHRAQRAKLRVFHTVPSGELPTAAYFIDYVEQQLVARYGARETFEGGLRVYTTLDLRMQQDALKAMKGILPVGPAGALVSIDPANGFIRAMTTTLDPNKTKFDLAWQAQRQLGSAMKPFALVAAVEEGANPATTYYNSRPLHIYLGPQAVPALLERGHLLEHLRRFDQPGQCHLAVRQHGLRPARPRPRAGQDRRRGPPDGNSESSHPVAIDRAGHRRRRPPGGRRRLRHAGQRGHPPRPAGDRQGGVCRRPRGPRQGARQASHSRGCGLRRRRDPAGQHPLRHGRCHAQLLHRNRGRQDRHHLQLSRRLVLRL